jgi:RNA polymerase sigma-70 factor (ECF subfamily)
MQDDNQLISRAQKGDNIAFEQLVMKYDRIVLNIAYGYRNSKEDAQDIYQEVFIRVYKNLSGFQFKSEFSTWLFRITTNVCISYKRKVNRPNHFSLDDENNSSTISNIPVEDSLLPDNVFVNTEFGNKINKALNTLSPNQKMSFLLKHHEGYKIKEIAGLMSCKEGTIKKYLFEAVRKLKVQLEGCY